MFTALVRMMLSVRPDRRDMIGADGVLDSYSFRAYTPDVDELLTETLGAIGELPVGAFIELIATAVQGLPSRALLALTPCSGGC